MSRTLLYLFLSLGLMCASPALARQSGDEDESGSSTSSDEGTEGSEGTEGAESDEGTEAEEATESDEGDEGDEGAEADEGTEQPDETAPEEAPKKASDKIVVTGSRIRTDPTDEAGAVVSVSGEDLAKSGLTSAADFLQHLPVSGGALNTKFNSSGNFGFPPDGGGIGAGATEADLRYLGSKRVLVLVDGVRMVDGSSGSGVPSATDLNTIPVGMIDRVEILNEGASPVYGSDAIGGVINIITKKEFEGVQANAYVGGYQQGDGATQQYDLLWGNRSDKMRSTLNLSFVRQGKVLAGDRAISEYPVPGLGACTPNCSSGTPYGRFYFTDPNTGTTSDLTLTGTPTGGTPVFDPLNPNSGDFKDFETTDRFNYAPFNYVLTPSQRFSAGTGVEYKLTPSVSMNARALYTNRQSKNQAAPEPLFIGPEAGNGNRMDTIEVDATNPYNPLGFTLDASTDYFIGRRPVEAGPRLFKQNVNTFYVAGGVDGSFGLGSNAYYWNAVAAYGVNRADQIKTGAFNSAKLQKALGPVDDCNADPECVPFNMFGGPGSITPEMLNYVMFVQKDVSQQTLFDLTANISGDVVKLPYGMLSFAAGVEHRQQAGFFQPDSIVTAGDSAGVPSSPTSGKYSVNEAYGEVRVPVLAHITGADLLDFGAAVRYSDYSTFGSNSTFRFGGRYRPIPDLLLRGNWGQGFRAPGIGELFGSTARFDQTISDPCSDMLGLNGGTPAPQNVVDNCIALGVPADGSYEQFNSQISVTTGGNPDLQPETSETLTAAVVYSPTWLERKASWVDDLSLEVNYYRIELTDAIQALDAQVQLDACVNTLDPVLCSGISRTSGGTINGFSNQLTNIGGIRTSGIDFTLRYLTPTLSFGQFRVTSMTGLLQEFTEIIPDSTGSREVERVGTEVGDPEHAYAKVKSSLALDYVRPRLTATWNMRYIGPVTEPCRGLSAYPQLCSDLNLTDDSLSTNDLAPVVYNDVQVSYVPPLLNDRLSLTLGVNNLLDQDPPNCYSCALNGFDATTYDVPGRFGYFKAGYRM